MYFLFITIPSQISSNDPRPRSLERLLFKLPTDILHIFHVITSRAEYPSSRCSLSLASRHKTLSERKYEVRDLGMKAPASGRFLNHAFRRLERPWHFCAPSFPFLLPYHTNEQAKNCVVLVYRSQYLCVIDQA